MLSQLKNVIFSVQSVFCKVKNSEKQQLQLTKILKINFWLTRVLPWNYFSSSLSTLKFSIFCRTFNPLSTPCFGLPVFNLYFRAANKIRRFRPFNWKFLRIFAGEKLLFPIINSIWKFLSSRLRGNRRNSTFSTTWYSAHWTLLADLSLVYFNLPSCFIRLHHLSCQLSVIWKRDFERSFCFSVIWYENTNTIPIRIREVFVLLFYPQPSQYHELQSKARNSALFFYTNQKKCTYLIIRTTFSKRNSIDYRGYREYWIFQITLFEIREKSRSVFPF